MLSSLKSSSLMFELLGQPSSQTGLPDAAMLSDPICGILLSISVTLGSAHVDLREAFFH